MLAGKLLIMGTALSCMACGRDQRELPEAPPTPPSPAPALGEDAFRSSTNDIAPRFEVLLRRGAPSPSRPSWIYFDDALWAFDQPNFRQLISIQEVANVAEAPVWGRSLSTEAWWNPAQPIVFSGGETPLMGGQIGDYLIFVGEAGWNVARGYVAARSDHPSGLFGAASAGGPIYVAQVWAGTLALQVVPETHLELPLSPPIDDFVVLGPCDQIATRPLVFASTTGVDVVAACAEGTLTRYHLSREGEVTESILLEGVLFPPSSDRQHTANCGGNQLVSDESRVLFAANVDDGGRLFSYEKSSGVIETLLEFAEEHTDQGQLTLAATEEHIFTLSGGCTNSHPLLCSFDKESLEEVGCHSIPHTIDGNDSHLVGMDGEAYFIFEDQRKGHTPAALDLSTTDLREFPRAHVVGEFVETESPLDLRCSARGCEVLSLEIDPDQPWPREDSENSRPVYYEVDFESEDVLRHPGDTLFWSRIPAASFAVNSEKYYSLDGRFDRTVHTTEGVRLNTFSEPIGTFVPIEDGILAWERGRVCRFSDDLPEPALCIEDQDYLQDSSGHNEMRLLRCNGEIYWSFAERTERFSDSLRSHRVRIAPFDLSSLEPRKSIVDFVVEYEAAPRSSPATGCTDGFFFVTEPTASETIHRFSLTGHREPSYEFTTSEMAGTTAAGIYTKDALVRYKRRNESSRLEFSLLGGSGSAIERAVALPGEARWVGKPWFFEEDVVLLISTRDRGDLKLVRLPLLLPQEVPSFEELAWEDIPPPQAPELPEGAGVECRDGVLWGSLHAVSEDDLELLGSCEIVAGDLTIDGASISDLSPLTSLHSVLGRLELTVGPELSDLTPLAGLRDLGGLSISATNPTDADVSLGDSLSGVTRIGDGGLSLAGFVDETLDIGALASLTGPIELSAAPNLSHVQLDSNFQLDRPVHFSMYGTQMSHCDIEALAARFGGAELSPFYVCGNVADECGDELCIARP